MPRISKTSSNSFVVFNQSGCFLPFLIVLNLFFGWMFFKPATWLFVEAALAVILLINSWFFVKKISSQTQSRTKRKGSIDIEAQVLDDKHRK
ncbi:MAG: hypothetical protein NTY47_00255, partial [Candidatus Omnitrophica bacterium]|nr:hypothetical protein [Candidatus Omnitrophota bacterium]